MNVITHLLTFLFRYSPFRFENFCHNSQIITNLYIFNSRVFTIIIMPGKKRWIFLGVFYFMIVYNLGVIILEKSSMFILWFDQLGIDDVPFVGGKNASLGEMYVNLTSKGIRIPNGFAVTAHAYRYFLDKAGIKDKIRDIIKRPKYCKHG